GSGMSETALKNQAVDSLAPDLTKRKGWDGAARKAALILCVLRGMLYQTPMPPSSATVIVADDHPVVLSGVRLALRRTKDLIVLAEAENGMAALAAIEKAPPDLLILDLWMDGNDGFDLLRRIHLSWPSVRVLIYSMNDER